MKITQTLMVLNTVMKNPGLNYEELERKIEEMYGKKNEAVVYLFLRDKKKNSQLSMLIDVIYCVEEIDSRYYYNSTLLPTDKDDITQLFIEGFLASKELREKQNG